MKKFKLILAVVAVFLCCVCLVGCIEEPPETDVAVKMGEEMYAKALAMSDRSKFVFETYDFGLLKKYKQDDIYYYCVTNFFENDVDIMSTDAMVKLKESLGLLLTAEKTAFVPIEHEESLFSGDYTIQILECEVERLVFRVNTFDYASAEVKEAGGAAAVVNTWDFVLARSYEDVENEEGKTVREYYWYVLDYTSPF